jgi:hypothetical protein
MAKKIDLRMPKWLVGQDTRSKKDCPLYLTHLEAPQFTARWCFGPPSPKPKDKQLYIEPSDEGDPVHLFDFHWIDPGVEDEAFEQLMSDAVAAIDQWLENNAPIPERHS